MNCSAFAELITEYLDGTLPKSRASAFAAHALQCRECHALLDDIKLAIEDVKGVNQGVDMPGCLENSLLRIQADYQPLTCADFEELITEFLDGFVPANVYHKFEAHTQGCSCCSGLLTEVVYAVAACHSVHTYEEFDVTDSLTERLLAVQPARKASFGRRITERVAAFAGSLMPRATQTRRWTYATASGLAVAVFAFLLFGFSDDGSVTGIYREARAKVFTLYSHSTDLYAQKDELIASLEKVGSNIGEMWATIGGESEAESAGRGASPKIPAPKTKADAPTKGGAGISVFGR